MASDVEGSAITYGVVGLPDAASMNSTTGELTWTPAESEAGTWPATLSGSWANGTDWGGDGDIFTGTVNIWGDPAFVNADGGDYHISPGFG